MGWGEKAIEIRSVSQGLLDGVFMHKRANKLKFLCERNDKVFFASVQSPSNSQVYFMSLPQRTPSYWDVFFLLNCSNFHNIFFYLIFVSKILNYWRKNRFRVSNVYTTQLKIIVAIFLLNLCIGAFNQNLWVL